MTSEGLHPLHRVDQTRLFVLGDLIGRPIVVRSLSIRQTLLRAAVFRQPLTPDALEHRSLLGGQRGTTAVIARHENLPLLSGRRGTDAVRVFYVEVADGAVRSRGLRAPASEPEIPGRRRA